VASETWGLFRPLVREIDGLGGVPVTLLVSPAARPGTSLAGASRFCAAMDGRLMRGDELALGGYGPARDAFGAGRDCGTPAAGAGHAPLAERDARIRIRVGLRQLMALDWPVRGFVAPGWRLDEGARAALRHLPFRYTSDRSGLIRLRDGRLATAPAVVGSDLGAPWRTPLSPRSRPAPPAGLDAAPCLRLALHPLDLGHPERRAFWLQVLDGLLAERRPLTLSSWLALAPV
jgi:predicted deacetylase